MGKLPRGVSFLQVWAQVLVGYSGLLDWVLRCTGLGSWPRKPRLHGGIRGHFSFGICLHLGSLVGPQRDCPGPSPHTRAPNLGN